MYIFGIEFDREDASNDDSEESQGSRELQIEQNHSITSDSDSDSNSEADLDETTDDEASISYSMRSRNQPGLKQICEVSMNHARIEEGHGSGNHHDNDITKENDKDRQTSEHESKKIEKPSDSKYEKIQSPKIKQKPTGGRIKAIACVLVVSLSLTIMLVAFLINHATRDAASKGEDSSSKNYPEKNESDYSSTNVVPEISLSDLPNDSLTEMTSVPKSYMPTPSPVSLDVGAPDAYTYFLNYISSFTKAEFLLDASRPQGRAFLQLVMDHNESFMALSDSYIRDSYAVLTFYFATSAKSEDASSTWIATSDVCSWDGVVNCVELQEGEKIVNRIALPQVGLSGSLPEEICLLEHLERLDLRSNNLSGVIPDCITGSSSLKNILLSDNTFTGYLPRGMLLMPTLEELVLSNNGFLGGLDTLVEGMFIKNLYRYGETWRIQRLNFDNNLFSGTVPTFFDAFGSLKSLTLHGNNLSGDVTELCERNGEELTELTADCRVVGCTCCTTCY